MGNTKGPTLQNYIAMFLSELLGTGLLLFLGCMGCATGYEEPIPTHHFSALTFGLTIMLIIQIFGHISGAHLNPAVTAATVIFRMLKPSMALVYILGQFLGAILGYGLLKVLVPSTYIPEGFCATTVNDNISILQAFGIEVVITTVLILICCGVWDKRNAAKADSVPLRFGFCIAAIAMCAGPLTGASMNTPRSLAPLVFGGSWEHHWIYWLAPNIAPFLGCGIYKFTFGDPVNDEIKRENFYLDEVPPESADKVLSA